jgi:hypothetical protein
MPKRKTKEKIEYYITVLGEPMVSMIKDLYIFAHNHKIYDNLMELVDLYFPDVPMTKQEMIIRLSDMKVLLKEHANVYDGKRLCRHCGRVTINKTICGTCALDKPIQDLFDSDRRLI